MKLSALAAITWGQVSFIGFLAVCFALVPSYLRSEGGVSNYGTLRQTIVFYTLAFGLAAFFNGLAARQLERQGRKVLAYNLYALSVLFILVLISTYPYKLNNTFSDIHQLAGLASFAFTFGFAAWLCFKQAFNLNHLLIFMFLIAGMAMLCVTIIGVAHLLFIGQSVSELAFAVLLVSCTRAILSDKAL
jgi:hypothetical protein